MSIGEFPVPNDPSALANPEAPQSTDVNINIKTITMFAL